MTDMEKSVDELLRRSMIIDEENIVYQKERGEKDKIALNLLWGMVILLIIAISVGVGFAVGYHSAMNEVTEKIIFTAIGLR